MIPFPAPGNDPRWRLAWFGAVGFVTLFGLAQFAGWVLGSITGASWWAEDLRLVLDAGARLAGGGDPYANPKFLYPPAAALVGAVFAPLDPLLVSVVYALGKVVLGATCVAWATRGWGRYPRILAVLGVTCSLPFLHDVMLGNANVLLVAAAMVALFATDRPRSGLALGVVTALFAKPLLVPILLLLLARRRRTFSGLVAGGLAVTAAGVLAAGPARYLDWVDALRAGSRYASPFAGNHGVTALLPEAWLPVAAVTGIGLVAVLWRGSWPMAVTWAVTSGILLAPYAGTYAALPVALAMPLFGPAMPLLAVLITTLSPVATTYGLPFFAAAVLVAALRLRPALLAGAPGTGPHKPSSSVG